MKSYLAKVSVKLKSNVKDVRGENLKRAIKSAFEVLGLQCHVGTLYYLQFEANNQVEALHLSEKIAAELLTNDAIEEYKIKSLEEV